MPPHLDLLQAALGLSEPWLVKDCDLNATEKRLDIWLDFQRGAVFACPKCGQAGCKPHDTLGKTWRHLNFFQHMSYLHARVPRVACPACGVRLANVPWARPESGFTLLFEALMMLMARDTPINAMARLVDEQDTRLWRIITHYVEEARSREDMSGVTQVGIDETSRAKRHDYVSVFVDLEESKVLYVTPGKGADTVEAFAQDLREHQADPAQITDVSCDMSPSFISGVGKSLPSAEITLDKFHLVKIVQKAVAAVASEERKTHPELLKNTRTLWLSNLENLKAWQIEQLNRLRLPSLNLKTARAYSLRLAFQEIFNAPACMARELLERWISWASRSRLEPMQDAARTMKAHMEGILNWHKSHITNGILEGINSLIQAAKAKARGYRSPRNLINMIYLIAGKLNYNLPT